MTAYELSSKKILIEKMEMLPEEKRSGMCWVYLISAHSGDYENSAPWDLFQGREWSCLLQNRPEYADRCPWEKLSGSDWAALLRKQPDFSEHCVWEKLDGTDWSSLLAMRPQFAGHCAWEKLNGSDWSGLLQKQPQFAGHCVWEKLSGRDWSRLLREQPRFVNRCHWKKLNDADWNFLLDSQNRSAKYWPWASPYRIRKSMFMTGQPEFMKMFLSKNVRGSEKRTSSSNDEKSCGTPSTRTRWAGFKKLFSVVRLCLQICIREKNGPTKTGDGFGA